MNSLTIQFEDASHLQSQIAYFYERFVGPHPESAAEQGIVSIAMFDDTELREEVARRDAAMQELVKTEPAANEPVKPERKPRATKPKTEPANEAAPPPADPNPTTPEVVDKSANAVAPDLPTEADLQALMSSYVATMSKSLDTTHTLDKLRALVKTVTGSTTLKSAPKETWPDLMRALEQDIKNMQAGVA